MEPYGLLAMLEASTKNSPPHKKLISTTLNLITKQSLESGKKFTENDIPSSIMLYSQRWWKPREGQPQKVSPIQRLKISKIFIWDCSSQS